MCSSCSLPGAICVPLRNFSGVWKRATLSLRCRNKTRFFESLLQFIKLSTNSSWSSNKRSTKLKWEQKHYEHYIHLHKSFELIKLFKIELKFWSKGKSECLRTTYPFEDQVSVQLMPNAVPFVHGFYRQEDE